MATLQVAMALAVPVKPDMLGQRLEAYAKVIPVLDTLRLCQRFGQGPDVHVTKIPVEIELIIEERIIEDQQIRTEESGLKWSRAFRHFEGRCEPMDHVFDPDGRFWLNCCEDADVQYCHACEEGGRHETSRCEKLCDKDGEDLCEACAQDPDPANCTRTCLAELHDEASSMAIECGAWDGWDPDGCQLSYDEDWDTKNCQDWVKMIDQSKKGAFVKYDKILREHFGLDVSFSNTQRADEDEEVWPRHPNHKWHKDDGLMTTICHLTVAKQVVQKQHYPRIQSEAEYGGCSGDAAQAIAMRRPPGLFNGKAIAVKRIGRAMRILGLKPHVHPSQCLSINLPGFGDTSDGEEEASDYTEESFFHDGRISPKMMLLVKSTHGSGSSW